MIVSGSTAFLLDGSGSPVFLLGGCARVCGNYDKQDKFETLNRRNESEEKGKRRMERETERYELEISPHELLPLFDVLSSLTLCMIPSSWVPVAIVIAAIPASLGKVIRMD